MKKLSSTYNFKVCCPLMSKYWDYDKNDTLPEDHTPYTKTIKVFKCDHGHSWEEGIYLTNRRKGCPYCLGSKVGNNNCLATKCPEIISWWHPTKNGKTTPYNITYGSNKIVWLICNKNHEFDSSPKVLSSGCRCPYCSGQRVCNDNCLLILFPDVAKDLHPTKNGTLTAKDIVAKSSKYYYWICKNGHEKYMRALNRVKNGCSQCKEIKSLETNNLEYMFPEIVNYWDYNKNDKLPREIFTKSRKLVYLKCSKGHCFGVKGAHRCFRNGFKCLKCENKILTKDTCLASLYPELSKEFSILNKNTPYDYLPSSNKSVIWRCKNNHYWSAEIYNRTINKTDCPYCKNKKVCYSNCLEVFFPHIAKELHPTKNGYIRATNINVGSKKVYWWLCNNGHEWEKSVQSRTYHKNNCPYCSNKRVCNDNCLAVTNPELLRDWNHKKNIITPYELTAGSTKKVWWNCSKGHTYTLAPKNKKRGISCHFCANKYPHKGNNLEYVFPELVKDYWDYDKNRKQPTEYLPFSSSVVWWRCKEGHKWKYKINKMVIRQYCLECRHKNSSTSCSKWLDNLKIETIHREKTIKISNKRYIADALKDNIVYEYLGNYWHGNPKHYNPSKINEKTKKKFYILLLNTIKRLNILSKDYIIIYRWEGSGKDIEYKPITMDKEKIIKLAHNIYENNLNIDILQC